VHALVTSHLRLVVKIAMGHRGYDLPISEVISEGNVGLMKALKRFEPQKGFRLSTYATWWIKASIQEYSFPRGRRRRWVLRPTRRSCPSTCARRSAEFSALDGGDMRTAILLERLDVWGR
jgi:RNA polymerase sigma-32 factor